MSSYALAHLIAMESTKKKEKSLKINGGMLPEDRKNFSLVGLQATEVSRRIDKLNQSDHEAALRLAGRCYQLVALTDLIVAGELDPTQPTQSSQSQSQSLASQSQGLPLPLPLPLPLSMRDQTKGKGKGKKRKEEKEEGKGKTSERRELSMGSLKYLQSLAEMEKKNGKRSLPTVSFNLLDHTLFGESHLLKRSEMGSRPR
jgi:hypothetical protein